METTVKAFEIFSKEVLIRRTLLLRYKVAFEMGFFVLFNGPFSFHAPIINRIFSFNFLS